MFKESSFLVALALVACLGNSAAQDLHPEADPSSMGSAETLPVLETEVGGVHKVRVPLYEDVVHTDQKRALDLKFMKVTLRKLREAAKAVIIDKRSKTKVTAKVMSLAPTFGKYFIDDMRLARTDTSPAYKKGFGAEISRVTKNVLSAQSDVEITAAEAFERVEILMDGIQKIVTMSPTTHYLDWGKLTIDGELVDSYMAPVVKHWRANGYDKALSAMNYVAGLMVKWGERGHVTVAPSDKLV